MDDAWRPSVEGHVARLATLPPWPGHAHGRPVDRPIDRTTSLSLCLATQGAGRQRPLCLSSINTLDLELSPSRSCIIPCRALQLQRFDLQISRLGDGICPHVPAQTEHWGHGGGQSIHSRRFNRLGCRTASLISLLYVRTSSRRPPPTTTAEDASYQGATAHPSTDPRLGYLPAFTQPYTFSTGQPRHRCAIARLLIAVTTPSRPRSGLPETPLQLTPPAAPIESSSSLLPARGPRTPPARPANPPRA